MKSIQDKEEYIKGLMRMEINILGSAYCRTGLNARSFTVFLHKYPKLEVILLTVDGIVLLTLGPFPGTATAGLVVNGRGFLL